MELADRCDVLFVAVSRESGLFYRIERSCAGYGGKGVALYGLLQVSLDLFLGFLWLDLNY